MKAKHILIALFLGAVLQATPAMAQLSAPGAPKPPVGVPADAKLFNGKWYKVIFEKISWTAAKDKCRTMGGQLVIIPDEVTWVFVRALYPGTVRVWFGATDEKTEGLWVWIDGSPVTFTAWSPQQPDNTRGNEHYLSSRNNAWNDVPKGDPNISGFICEWKDK